MSDHQYPITYQITAHENGPTSEEVNEQGLGGCDSFVFMSFIGEPGAPCGLSTMVFSGSGIDHKEGEAIRELEPSQQFVAWVMFTRHLIDILPEDDPRIPFLETAFDIAAGGARRHECDDERCVCNEGHGTDVVS